MEKENDNCQCFHITLLSQRGTLSDCGGIIPVLTLIWPQFSTETVFKIVYRNSAQPKTTYIEHLCSPPCSTT